MKLRAFCSLKNSFAKMISGFSRVKKLWEYEKMVTCIFSFLLNVFKSVFQGRLQGKESSILCLPILQTEGLIPTYI